MLTITANGQNTYGKTINIKDLFVYFERKLAKDWTGEQVVYAIDKYTDENDDVPTPSAINKILSPARERITTTEYQAALRKQKDNGYPKFSYEETIINEYRAQREGADEKKRTEVETIKQLGNPLKRIEA